MKFGEYDDVLFDAAVVFGWVAIDLVDELPLVTLVLEDEADVLLDALVVYWVVDVQEDIYLRWKLMEAKTLFLQKN